MAKRLARQKARAAAVAALVAKAAAKAAARVAAQAAVEEAARAEREAYEADLRAVAEVWKDWVDEMTNEGTLPITDEDRREAQDIVARFGRQTLSNDLYFLTKLERMYNAELEERYAATREKFRNNCQIVSELESIMYHGTAAHNVDK